MSQKLPSDSADRDPTPAAVCGKRHREVLPKDMEDSLKEVKAKLLAMEEMMKMSQRDQAEWTERTQRELRQLGEKNEYLERKLEQFEGQNTKKRRCYAEIEGSTSRSLQLKFTSQPSPKIFTMTKVTGENSDALCLVLVDPLTGEVVSSGPEASIEVGLVLVHGDFIGCESGNWKLKYFKDNIILPRKGKRPLLVGDIVLKLDEGIGLVGNLKITDNSIWVPSRSFRLAARVASGYVNGMRIQEAITNSFEVKEGRLKSSQKHYPPAPNDEVWRLVGIAKNGVYHKRLTENGVVTVEDFLKSLTENRNRLQDNILEMPSSDWEDTVKHAETCILSGEMVTVNHAETCILSSKTVSGPIFKQPLNPGFDISQATEVVDDQSVQAVYEQHQVVGVSSNVHISSFSHGSSKPAVQNDISSYHQRFGESSNVTSQSFTASSHTALRNGSNKAGYKFRDDDYVVWEEDFCYGDGIPPTLECPEADHVRSAMPAEWTAGKHRAYSNWFALGIAMAFSVRIVAVKGTEVETP